MRLLGLLLPLLAIGGLHLLSSRTPSQLPTLPAAAAGGDKIAHAIAYALLLSCFRGWRGWRARPGEWIPGAAAASLLVAVGDELHQGLVPGRTPDFADLLADGVGIGVAALLWWWGSVRWGHRRLS